MRIHTFALAICLATLLTGPAWSLDCRPQSSDVVSIGKHAAHYYAKRALLRKIAAEKSSAIATNGKAVHVTKPVITCKPFPNLLGADEWECFGKAKVCVEISR